MLLGGKWEKPPSTYDKGRGHRHGNGRAAGHLALHCAFEALTNSVSSRPLDQAPAASGWCVLSAPNSTNWEVAGSGRQENLSPWWTECVFPHPQRDGVRRWGLWEVTGFHEVIGWDPSDGIGVLVGRGRDQG